MDAVYTFQLKHVDKLPTAMPPSLLKLGVTQELWVSWLDKLREIMMEKDAFYGRPCSECCFWCCPLLCVQTCWCMGNPRTHRQAARLGEARVLVEQMINADLAALGGSGITNSHLDGYFQFSLSGVGMFIPRGRSRGKCALATVRVTIFDKALPDAVPATLSATAIGVTDDEWRRWMAILEAERRAHLCYAAPDCAPIYQCCPLGPIQCCLCALNPLNCYFSHRTSRERERATGLINAELVPKGLCFEYQHDIGVFRRGMPKPKRRHGKRSLVGRTIAIAGAAVGGSLVSAPIVGGMSARVMEEEALVPVTPPGHVKV